MSTDNTGTASRSGTVQENLTEQVQREALRVARLLRAAADDVERHARVAPGPRSDLRDGHLDHADIAQEVARDVSSLMGNLHLDALIAMAAVADRYARGGEQA